MENKNVINYTKVLTFSFIVLFIYQFGMLIYINLFQNSDHLGVDASIVYLKAIEIWKSKSLTPEFIRSDLTNLHLDMSVPFAALLYGIIGDIFVSFGLVNIIISACIITMFVSVLKDFGIKSLLAIIIPLNLLLSPYIVEFNNGNPLNDFLSLLYVSVAFWGFRVLTGLLCIKSFYFLYKKRNIDKKRVVLLAITTVMVFICGVSSGFYILVTFIAPLFLFIVIKTLNQSDLRSLLSREMIFTLALVCIVFVGRVTASLLFGFSPDDSKVLASSDVFFVNLGSIYLGYVELLGGLVPFEKIPIFSLKGILILINFAVANMILFSLFFVISFVRKYKFPNAILIHLCIIAFNVLMFAVSFMTYDSPIFENRYLIPMAVSLFAVFSYFISIVEGQVNKQVILLPLLCGFLIFSNICSHYQYITTRITEQKSLAKMIDKYDCGLVYATDSLVVKNLRVLDTTRIYHTLVFFRDGLDGVLWEEAGYTYYETGEYKGKTMLLAWGGHYDTLPEDIKQQYVYQEALEYNNWNIYVGENHMFSFKDNLEVVLSYPDPQLGAFLEFMYLGLFDRSCDPVSEIWPWFEMLETNNMTGREIAAVLIASPEFTEAVGTDNAEYVKRLYDGLLRFEPPEEDLNFHVGNLDHGHITKEALLDMFTEVDLFKKHCTNAGLMPY